MPQQLVIRCQSEIAEHQARFERIKMLVTQEHPALVPLLGNVLDQAASLLGLKDAGHEELGGMDMLPPVKPIALPRWLSETDWVLMVKEPPSLPSPVLCEKECGGGSICQHRRSDEEEVRKRKATDHVHRGDQEEEEEEQHAKAPSSKRASGTAATTQDADGVVANKGFSVFAYA